MALEIANNISDLVATNPGINDPASRGDDHIRLVKQVLLNDLGSLGGPLTVSAADINNLAANQQSYTDSAISDALFGDGNTGTVGSGGVVGDYKDADNALQEDINQNASDISSVSSELQTLKNNYLRSVYPVGSVYINASNSNNPGTILGFGTWSAFGQGRVLIGAGQTSDGREARTFAGGAAGGEFAHALTIAEMPSHRHSDIGRSLGDADGSPGGQGYSGTHYTGYEGGNQPHNNMQPYITVYMWRRVS